MKALTIFRIAAPLLVVGGGIAVMALLVATKPSAEAKTERGTGTVVRTQRVEPHEVQVTVPAQGTVVAAREVRLQPEVSGRVVFRSENLVPGGRFEKGELLLRIDPSQYALEAEQSKAQLAQAEQQVALEESRGEIAKQEWSLIGEDMNASEAGKSAALREPQKQEALARMKAAEHAKDAAQLNLGRTSLRAPFDGFVRSGQVDVGQYVTPGASLGSLVGSEKFWLQVSVPVARLKDIHVPGFNASEEAASSARIWQELGEAHIERNGRVVRLLGDVDPVGRMARVLIEIDDPLGLERPQAERGLPLLLGSYVHVEISGTEMQEVIEVPRSAVHAGRFVYVFGPEAHLEVREVEIAWRRPRSFLLHSGLREGDEIITSRLGTAVDGLKLRRLEDEPEPPVTAVTTGQPESAEPVQPQGAKEPIAQPGE